jgi:hypothetical protein
VALVGEAGGGRILERGADRFEQGDVIGARPSGVFAREQAFAST